MAQVLSYEKGHLVVAAVRILGHRQHREPTAGEIASLCDLSEELVHVLLRQMVDRGILRPVESPYDTRYELGDHLLLEELPKEADSPKLQEEVARFQEKVRDRQEAMDRLFGDADRIRKKKERLSRLEEELRRFKKGGRGGRPPHPFADEDY
jgi:hypothetical protein